MRLDWKRTLAGLSVAVLMSGMALAQEPGAPATDPPPPPAAEGQHHGWGLHPHMQLSADQQARMKAVREQFGSKREADEATFQSQFKSILTKDQLALVQQHENARKQRMAAFKRGEDEARQKLQQSGQPLPKNAPNHDGGAFFGPTAGGGPGGTGPNMMWGEGRPMMAFGGRAWGREGGRHHGHHGQFADLKLTPEQMGEVQVFRQSMMEKRRAEMKDMMEQMRGILTPEQQQQMQQRRGPHPPPPAP